MAEEAGGFFARLALNTDEASFSRGIGKIGDVAEGLKGLLVAGAGLAGLTLSFKALIDAASEQAKLGQMALSLGMSATNLQNWSAAVRIAGSNADSFVSSISNLNQKMVDLRAFGEKPGDKFWIAVRGIGVNPNSMLGMNNDQRIAALMKGAENLAKTGPLGLQNAQTFLREAMGQSAVDLLLKARQNGVSVQSLYNRGAAASFTNGSDMTGAAKGIVELNQAAETMKGAFNLFSTDVMKDLTPALKTLNGWLMDHKEDIKAMIDGLAQLTAAILIFAGSTLGKILGAAGAELSFLTAKTPEEKKKAAETAGTFGYSMAYAIAGLIPGLREKMDTPEHEEKYLQSNEGKRLLELSRKLEITINDRTQGGISATGGKSLDLTGMIR